MRKDKDLVLEDLQKLVDELRDETTCDELDLEHMSYLTGLIREDITALKKITNN